MPLCWRRRTRPAPWRARPMQKIAKGEGGPLAGIPLGIKDLFATKDVRTTACSKILGNFVPPYESTVTSQLWRDGAVMLGKLNNDEFAMGSSNETSCFGPVVNPWRREGSDTKLVPGGSSGGSASAVAALLCMGATATDTGGSIRQPAAFTGNRRHQADLWALLALGHRRLCLLARPGRPDRAHRAGRRDPDALDGRSRPQGHHLGRSRGAGLRGRGRKVGQGHEDRHPRGIPPRRHAGGNRKAVERGRRLAEGRRRRTRSRCRCRTPNTRCRPIISWRRRRPRRTSPATTACATACACPAARSASMYENTRAEGFGAEVRRRVMIGTYVLSAGYYDAYYLRAQKVRTLIKRDFEDCFAKGVHAILTPATPSAAFGIGEKGGRSRRDVPQRHFHGDGEHGGVAGHRGSRRPGCARSAARPATDRAPVR